MAAQQTLAGGLAFRFAPGQPLKRGVKRFVQVRSVGGGLSMDTIRKILAVSICIFIVVWNFAWANTRTEPSRGAFYLFIIVAVLGAIIAILGIILAFRGVKLPAEVQQ